MEAHDPDLRQISRKVDVWVARPFGQQTSQVALGRAFLYILWGHNPHVVDTVPGQVAENLVGQIHLQRELVVQGKKVGRPSLWDSL